MQINLKDYTDLPYLSPPLFTDLSSMHLSITNSQYRVLRKQCLNNVEYDSFKCDKIEYFYSQLRKKYFNKYERQVIDILENNRPILIQARKIDVWLWERDSLRLSFTQKWKTKSTVNDFQDFNDELYTLLYDFRTLIKNRIKRFNNRLLKYNDERNLFAMQYMCALEVVKVFSKTYLPKYICDDLSKCISIYKKIVGYTGYHEDLTKIHVIYALLADLIPDIKERDIL